MEYFAREGDHGLDQACSAETVQEGAASHTDVAGKLTWRQYALELLKKASRMNERIEGIRISMYLRSSL